VRHFLTAATAATAAAAVAASPPLPSFAKEWRLAHSALTRQLAPTALLGCRLRGGAGLPEDHVRALRALKRHLPPQGPAGREWSSGGRILLEYCAVVANFYAFTTAAAAGELAPRTPDSVRQSAEQLLEALRGEAAAQRRSLERDEALHGAWSEEAAAWHACRRSMEENLGVVRDKLDFYAGYVAEADPAMVTD